MIQFILIKEETYFECASFDEVVTILGVKVTQDRRVRYKNIESKITYSMEYTAREILFDYVKNHIQNNISSIRIYKVTKI